MTSRKNAMVLKALEMAEDDSHGYSQKPPSGRWGPDYDCSSFMYEIADSAGYSVGRGPDKVRYTGVMLKDFKDAGFEILPFANVGLGELEIGDILLNLAVHAEVYVGEGQSVGAMSSETGKFTGEAGDQTGEEISKHPIKDVNVQWNYILRPPNEEDDEGDDGEMPNFPMTGQSWQGGYQQSGWRPNQMNGYSQGYQQGGYPQGNMGQMNGYSQANTGGWPQAGQQQGAKFVSGIQEANERYVSPGVTEAFVTNDWKHLIMKTADQQGYPSMRVFDIQECMEPEMPQHGGMMQEQGEMVTRQEFDQLKEMVQNVQSAISESGFPQAANGNSHSGGQQSNGRSGRNAQ